MMKFWNKYSQVEQHLKPTTYSLMLALVVLLAAFLRFYKLGEWSFWGDEFFTVGGREDGFNYTLIRSSLSMSLIQFVVGQFGITEWYARLVPALLGVVSIPVLYWLTKKMFNPEVGLAAALLLAVSTWHVYWSQNARFYVPLLLFYTAALIFFHLGLEQDRLWYFVATIFFLGLATKERLLALFFVPVVVSYVAILWLIPFERPAGLRWRNLLVFFAPLLGSGLFFAGPYLQNLSAWMKGFGNVNNNPVWLLVVVIYYVGLPTVIAAGLGAVYFLAKKDRGVLLLSLGAVVPLIILMGLALFHYTASRYVFMTLTSWVILAALAAVELIRQSRGQHKILAASLLLLLVAGSLGENVLYYRYQNGNRDNWKDAFELVKAEKQAGDLVVSINPELADFYMQEKTMAIGEIDLNLLETGQQRVWFVEDSVALEQTPIHPWLVSNTQLIQSLDVQARAQNFKMKVYLYDPTNKIRNFSQ